MRFLWSIIAMLRGVPACCECGRPKTPMSTGANIMGWNCLVCYEKLRRRLRERTK